MILGKITLGLFCAFLCFNLSGQIVINEICSKNGSILLDSQGDFSDWIEFYNINSDSSVNLEGFYLSDDVENLQKWTFPNISIEPNSHLLLFASGEDTLVNNEIHTNFSIKSEGEALFLSNPLGLIIDSLVAKALLEDESYGRISDGNNGWITFLQPSHLQSNDLGIPKYEITFSHSPGHYLEEILLEMQATYDLPIYYTTDGALPNTTSNLFTSDLLLGTRAGEADILSIIQCTEEPYTPLQESKKANIIRAQIFDGDQALSPIYTQTYLIDPDSNRYSLPIISLVGEADHFFDSETGIFVYYHLSGHDWERPVHIELFDTNGTLQYKASCGVRIHGLSSSASRQKSLKFYARSEYGTSKFEYPFFPQKKIAEYNRFILRKPRRFINGSFMTDELITQLLIESGRLGQAHQPVIAFLNGEYWGLYYMREKLDEYFIEENLGLDSDSVIMVNNDPLINSNCNAGDCTEYLDLSNIYHDLDSLNDSTYQLVAQHFDIDNYIYYLTFEFFFANSDWPNNNLRKWKLAGSDQWKHIIYDMDHSFSNFERTTIEDFLTNDGTHPFAYKLGQLLFQHPDFKEAFKTNVEYQLNHLLNQENIIPLIDSMAMVIAPELEEYHLRFATNYTTEQWENSLEAMREFVTFRPCVIKDHLDSLLNLTIEIDSCYAINEEIVEEVDTGIYVPASPFIATEQLILPEIDMISTTKFDSIPNGNLGYISKELWIEQQILKIFCSNDESANPIQLIIYNASGQVLKTDQLKCSEINSGLNHTYLKNYSPGLYLLQIVFESQVQSFKVIKSS